MTNRILFLNLFSLFICSLISTPVNCRAADSCGPMLPVVEQSLQIQQQQSQLIARIKELETRRCVSEERLLQKKVHQLKEIGTDVKLQRQSMEDFQRFVSWMNLNLAGYTKYIKAGSYAALVGRMLPIPYAGQASIFTKFAAQFTIALNNASVSINCRPIFMWVSRLTSSSMSEYAACWTPSWIKEKVTVACDPSHPLV